MSRQFLTIVCITLLSTSTLVAQAVPTPGPIDVDSLRNRVLQHAFAASSVPFNFHEVDEVGEPTPAETWGIEVMDVPPLFVRSVPELSNGPGLLITRVFDGSPAWKAGLRKGQILLDIDDRRLIKLCDLPALVDAHSATVLTDEGFKKILAQPSQVWLGQLVNSVARPFAEQTGKLLLGLHTADTIPQVVSMTDVNGQITCTAVVNTQHGQKEVRLHGTRTEVEAQLKCLPVDLQAVLRSQIGF